MSNGKDKKKSESQREIREYAAKNPYDPGKNPEPNKPKGKKDR